MIIFRYNLLLHACVYYACIYICVFTYVGTHSHVCVSKSGMYMCESVSIRVWEYRPEVMLGVFLIQSSPYSLKEGLSGKPRIHQYGWPSYVAFPGEPLSLPPGSRNYRYTTLYNINFNV